MKDDKKMPESRCEDCQFYVYDEENDCYVCDNMIDEDEFERATASLRNGMRCPYFRFYDEYKVVKKQN